MEELGFKHGQSGFRDHALNATFCVKKGGSYDIFFFAKYLRSNLKSDASVSSVG